MGPRLRYIAVQLLSVVGASSVPSLLLEGPTHLNTQSPEPWELPTRNGQAIQVGAQLIPLLRDWGLDPACDITAWSSCLPSQPWGHQQQLMEVADILVCQTARVWICQSPRQSPLTGGNRRRVASQCDLSPPLC